MTWEEKLESYTSAPLQDNDRQQKWNRTAKINQSLQDSDSWRTELLKDIS